MNYSRIFIALDGSPLSDAAVLTALALAQKEPECELLSCHAYAARLHFDRFEAMEKGLPQKYQEETQLDHLRRTHDDLIENGLELISDSYTRSIAGLAAERGIRHRSLLPEGKNYLKILESIEQTKPELAILGSSGMGETPRPLLGSVAERVLLYAKDADILLIKDLQPIKNEPIVVGIDGSDESYHALERALDLALALESEVIAAAVYDPFFHSTVFRKIADVLPPKDQEKFNFSAQEKLHDEIIDDGLEKVYRDGLERAVLFARGRGVEIKTEMLEGKVYTQICQYAARKHAGLVVLGRHGLHREIPALIGSNASQICRLSEQNVLIVSPAATKVDVPHLQRTVEPLAWTAEAEQSLGRIPEFVRARAKWTIEECARAHGQTCVTPEIVKSVRSTLGMGRGNPPAAEERADSDCPNEAASPGGRSSACGKKERGIAAHRTTTKNKAHGRTSHLQRLFFRVFRGNRSAGEKPPRH